MNQQPSRGRPDDINDLELRDKALELQARGLPIAQIADVLEVEPERVRAWAKNEYDPGLDGIYARTWRDDAEINRRTVNPNDKRTFPVPGYQVLVVLKSGFRLYAHRASPETIYAPLYHRTINCRAIAHYFLTGRRAGRMEEFGT